MAVVPVTAAAFPSGRTECNVPFDSKVPYQAVIELHIPDGDATYKRLVYRGDDLNRTEVEAYGESSAFIQKSQAGFALSVRSSKGTTVFKHHNPTDRYAADQKLTDAEFESDGPDGKKIQHGHYEYFPDETMTIGTCTLAVTHLKVTVKETGATTETWFSRDLQTQIKKIVTKDKTTAVAEVKSVSIDDVPKEAESEAVEATRPHD